MKKIKYTLIKDLILLTKSVSINIDRFVCQHSTTFNYHYFYINNIFCINIIIINLKSNNIELLFHFLNKNTI